MKLHQALEAAIYTVAAVLCTAAIVGMSHGQTTAQRNSPLYDPASEVSVKGTVEAVRQMSGRRGWGGTHLTLKTDKESVEVHVGPTWFLSREKAEFAEGDEIEVVGSKITYQGAPAILAREITKGDKKLTLRDEQGVPLWSRGRRR